MSSSGDLDPLHSGCAGRAPEQESSRRGWSRKNAAGAGRTRLEQEERGLSRKNTVMTMGRTA
jgi:hypothetical protein